MSRLTIYPETGAQPERVLTDFPAIAQSLAAIGVRFERWDVGTELPDDASEDEIIGAYREAVDALMSDCGFQSVDVVSIHPDHANREALRKKFLDEHTHSEDEVRFFVDGRGMFYLHKNARVYMLLCERGDLVSVPDGTPHWFDMGPNPSFTCIRLFTNPEGWVANFTGSDISSRYPRFGE